MAVRPTMQRAETLPTVNAERLAAPENKPDLLERTLSRTVWQLFPDKFAKTQVAMYRTDGYQRSLDLGDGQRLSTREWRKHGQRAVSNLELDGHPVIKNFQVVDDAKLAGAIRQLKKGGAKEGTTLADRSAMKSFARHLERVRTAGHDQPSAQMQSDSDQFNHGD